MIKVWCEQCQLNFSVDPVRLNKQNPLAKCPKCAEIIQVKLPLEPKSALAIKGFLIIHKVSAKKKYFIEKGKNTIGRKSDSGNTDIMIETDADTKMSRQHFVIEHLTNKKGNPVFLIYDANSKNGTFVNGTKLLKGQSMYDVFYLNDNDSIKAGNTELLFRTETV